VKVKRAKPFNANKASVDKLTAEGWTCQIVEYRIPHCFITKDCFEFGDILAISPSRGTMLVQATGGGNGSSRIKKIEGEPKAAIWMACGNRIQVHDWVKVKDSKQRECRIYEIELKDE
jgi:hypothetical protein